MNEKELAELSTYISWRLAYERRAGCYRLFEAVPPFAAEYELLNLTWWQGLEATRLAPDLLYLVEENRKEIGDLVREARQAADAREYLAYAMELQNEMTAASRLIERLDNARS